MVGQSSTHSRSRIMSHRAPPSRLTAPMMRSVWMRSSEFSSSITVAQPEAHSLLNSRFQSFAPRAEPLIVWVGQMSQRRGVGGHPGVPGTQVLAATIGKNANRVNRTC
jgi:hypothetical protein